MSNASTNSTPHLDSPASPAPRRIVAACAIVLAAAVGWAGPAQSQESSDSQQSESASEEQSDSPRDRAVAMFKRAQRLYHEGQWYRARTLYEKAYETAPGDSKVRVHAALGLSTLLWEQGDYAAARNHIDSAMDLAEELELDTAIGRLLLTLGHIEASRGQLGSAEKTLGHCTKLAAEQNDAVFGPLCKLNRRLVRKLQGKSVASREAYRKALEKLESVDSPLTVGLSLAKTAELYAEGGSRGQAFQMLDRAGKQYEKAGSVPAQARNRMMKARLLQETGSWNKARKYLEGLVETFQGMGSKPALIDALGLLGNDAQKRGSWEEARNYYDRALELARSTGSPQKQAKVEVALCELGARSGNFEETAPRCESAIETLEKFGMWRLVANAKGSLGRAAQATGHLDRARKALLGGVETREERVHSRFREERNHARDLANLCQIEMRMELEGALYRCRSALEELDANRDSGAMIAATHYGRGNAAASAGHLEEAATHLKKAASMFEKAETVDYRRYADARLRQGAVYKKLDKPKKALEAFHTGLETLENADAAGLASLRIQLRTQYAQLLLGRKDWEEASAELRALAEEAKRANDVESRAWALSALARAHNGEGDHEAARSALEQALPLAERAGDEALVETIESNLEQLSN